MMYYQRNVIKSYNLLSCISSISTKSTLIVPNRIFYRISGVDSRKFLQGICTNDVNKLDKHGDCIAAAFLTPGGRIVADALLYNVENNIVIETHSSLGNSLDRYLRVYKLRSKVTIEKLDELKCILEVDDKSSTDIAELGKSLNAVVGAIDPRTNEMGTRFLVPKDKVKVDDSKKFEMWYDRFRLLRGIAEGPAIVDRIPIECNLDLLNYISFSKGCYVGQELTARTKYKGLVRKRLVPFMVSNVLSNGPFHTIDKQYLLKKATETVDSSANANVIANDRIFLSVDGVIQGNIDKASSIGEVVESPSGSALGVAMLRLSNILTKDDSGNKKFVTSNNQIIATFRPNWFPDIDPTTGKDMGGQIDETNK